MCVGPLVEVERVPEPAKGAQVPAEASGGLQGVRVVCPKDFPLCEQHLGVEVMGCFEAPLRAQHVSDLNPQVKGLLVARPNCLRPLLLQSLPHLQRRLQVASFP